MPTAQDQIDTRALEIAALAAARADEVERLMTVKIEGLREQMHNLTQSDREMKEEMRLGFTKLADILEDHKVADNERTRSLYRRWDAVAAFLIVGLLSICGTLAAYIFTHSGTTP